MTEAVRGGNSDQAARATSGGSASACAMAHVPRKAAWVEAVEGVPGSARGALLKSWEDAAGNQVGTDNGHVGWWLGATAGGSHGHQRSSCNPSQSAMCCLEASCVYLAPVVTASYVICRLPSVSAVVAMAALHHPLLCWTFFSSTQTTSAFPVPIALPHPSLSRITWCLHRLGTLMEFSLPGLSSHHSIRCSAETAGQWPS